MANYYVVIPGSGIPLGSESVILTNLPGSLPSVGLSSGVDPQTFPGPGGVPAAPTNGIGNFVTGALIDATGNNQVDHLLITPGAACQVIKITFNQTVIENTSATTTLMPRKVASAQALASGKSLLTAALNLKTGVVANTPLSPALTATAADLIFAATDSLGLDFTNAITEYIGYITVWFSFL